MLLGFPAHQLARLLLLDALDLNLLDDDVAAADGGDDMLGAGGRSIERDSYRVGDDSRIHDLALDDGVGWEHGDGDFDELRLAASMIDDGYLDESGADIESDCGLLATE